MTISKPNSKIYLSLSAQEGTLLHQHELPSSFPMSTDTFVRSQTCACPCRVASCTHSQKGRGPREPVCFLWSKRPICQPTLASYALGFPEVKSLVFTKHSLKTLTSDSIDSSTSSTLLSLGAPYRLLISASVLPESAAMSYNCKNHFYF